MTTDRPLAFRFHRRHLLWSLFFSAANRASPDSSYCIFSPLPLIRRCESLDLYLDEHATHGSYSTVEIGRVGALQIGEEAADPREMLFEQFTIGAEAAGKRRHASPAMISHRIAA